MAESEKDPLTILTDGVAEFLQDSAAVKRAMGMAKKNIHAFNKTRGTEEVDVVSESDVPEIRLESDGGPSNINIASNLVNLDANYSLMINSGDQRITHILNPVYWAVFATFAAGISDSPLTKLRWRERPFMRKYELLQTTIGKSDPQFNRGIKGWTTVCQLTFHLYFNQSDITAFIQGT